MLGKIPIEVGHPGRGGVDGLPGEAGGHSRFGAVVTPGGGRKVHSPFPEPLVGTVTASISSAVLANYVEINNGLGYLSGAGWASYNVAELPGPFRGALCVWVDLSWTDAPLSTDIPLEVIVELITPTGTATFDVQRDQIRDIHSSRTHWGRPGTVRLPPDGHPSRCRSSRTKCFLQHRRLPWPISERRYQPFVSCSPVAIDVSVGY